MTKRGSFSKSIMGVVVMLYFVGAAIGAGLVVLSAIADLRMQMPIGTSMFVAYAAYIGGPTATAIGFYSWKSKAENMLKIDKGYDSSYDEMEG